MFSVISNNAVDIFICNISFNKNLIVHSKNVTNVDVDLQLGCNKLHSSIIIL